MLTKRSMRTKVNGLLTLMLGVAGAAVLFGATFLATRQVVQVLASDRPPPSAPAYVGEGTVSRTDRSIGALQERLRQRMDDQPSQTALGLAYLQKARETGDPGYYTRAEGVLSQALERAPDDADTLVGLGALALARHRFEEGLGWGERAVAANPHKAAAYGVVGDAYVELGRYEDAVATFQRMVDVQPGQAAYARVSYARELHGDVVGAIEAMELAVSAGVPGTEATEWTRVQLGHLHFNRGDLDSAAAAYTQSLALSPGSVHALGGLARVAAARGDFDGAIDLYARATERLPVPELVIGLGDAYRAAGRIAEAERQDELVRVIQRLYAENGVDTDLEMALFDVDRGLNLDAAVAQARGEWAKRRGIHVADTLAWALYRRGDCREADGFAREALRLGTRDALLLFHAGRIAECAGDPTRARSLLAEALTINPHFSLRYSAEAHFALASIGGPR